MLLPRRVLGANGELLGHHPDSDARSAVLALDAVERDLKLESALEILS